MQFSWHSRIEWSRICLFHNYYYLLQAYTKVIAQSTAQGFLFHKIDELFVVNVRQKTSENGSTVLIGRHEMLQSFQPCGLLN